MIWNGNDWMIESFLSLDRTDKDRQQELIKRIEDLEGDYNNTWWKVALGLLVAPVAGIFITPEMFTVAVSYGVTTTVSSKLKLEALKRNISVVTTNDIQVTNPDTNVVEAASSSNSGE